MLILASYIPLLVAPATAQEERIGRHSDVRVWVGVWVQVAVSVGVILVALRLHVTTSPFAYRVQNYVDKARRDLLIHPVPYPHDIRAATQLAV